MSTGMCTYTCTKHIHIRGQYMSINLHKQDEEIVGLPAASPGFPMTPQTNKGMHNLTLFLIWNNCVMSPQQSSCAWLEVHWDFGGFRGCCVGTGTTG